MAEIIVNKVTLGKSFLISIKYTEGQDAKALESNKEWCKSFRENLKSLRECLNTYLGYDGVTSFVEFVNNITFSNTDKQMVKLTFRAVFKGQSAGVGIALENGNAYLETFGEDKEPDALAALYKNIKEIQLGCLRYLEGERAQQELPM